MVLRPLLDNHLGGPLFHRVAQFRVGPGAHFFPQRDGVVRPCSVNGPAGKVDELGWLDRVGGVEDMAQYRQVVLSLRFPGQVHEGVGLLGQRRQFVSRPG